MRFGLVLTMATLLLLGGVALAGGDGDRCGGGCGDHAAPGKPVADRCGGACDESRGDALKEGVGATGEEGEEGEGGDALPVEKAERQIRVRMLGAPDGEKEEVKIQLAGDWESLSPEAKKQILDSLRGTVDEETLKQILEGLVKGEAKGEEGAVRIFSTPRVAVGRALMKRCPDCAGMDAPCEKCRKAMQAAGNEAFRLYLKEGEGPEGVEIEELPAREMVKVQRMGGVEGVCPMCGRPVGPQSPRMRMGAGGRGPQGRMGPGPRRGGGMGMRGRGRPGAGMPDGMGRELLEALNGLRDEIRALRNEMRAGHGAPPVVRGRMSFDGKDGAPGGTRGVIVLPGGAGGAGTAPGAHPAPKAPTAIRLRSGGAGGAFYAPPRKAADGLQREVDQLKTELKALKARMAVLLDHLEKAQPEKK